MVSVVANVIIFLGCFMCDVPRAGCCTDDVVSKRQFTAQEVDLLAAAAGFEVSKMSAGTKVTAELMGVEIKDAQLVHVHATLWWL